MSDQTSGCWAGFQRPYSTADVAHLRGSVHIEQSPARLGGKLFWCRLRSDLLISGFGCGTGNHANATQTAPGNPSPRRLGT